MSQKDFPELVINYDDYKEMADNVWQAQMGGHPAVLTYNGPGYLDVDKVTYNNRKQAMHTELDGQPFEIPRMLSRDEYPFACTKEGGKSSFIGHIPGRQNSAQGGLISAMVKKHHLEAGRQFRVKVVNHPKSGKV